MDTLSDILSALRLRGMLYFSTALSPPWGLRVPVFERVARFHLVARGHVWVKVGDDEPFLLETGDMVLVPHGAQHSLLDAPETVCCTVGEVVAAANFKGEGALVYGGEDTGTPTRLVCGHFAFADGLDHPLLTQLPSAIRLRWDEAMQDSSLENAFRFIVREIQQAQPGHEAVVARLSEVLFVQVIRVWVRQQAPDRGLVAALTDSRLGPALEALHTDPARGWTLDTLAREANMGRTAFAERFRAAVGDTPHQYLTRWRLMRAQQLLAESDLSLAQIAERVGYDSPASFSRTFKRVVGQPPGGYRRKRQEGMDDPQRE